MAYTSKYTLPSFLDARVLGRSHAALNHLKVEGTKVRYVGPGEDDSQAATIRTNVPVPPDCPLYYFEVEIISSGDKGYIGIGFQTEDVLLSRLPGWDPHSYGYHGDDGHAFKGSGLGDTYGPTYGTGDIMGALFNRVDRTISFYKNGESLGVAFYDVPEDRLFPCVGLRTQNEEVCLHLGSDKRSATGLKSGSSKAPFLADFQAMQDSLKAKVLADINTTPLPLQSSKATPLIPQLLYDHLMHHRYWRTAAAIKQDLLQSSNAGFRAQSTPDQEPEASASQQQQQEGLVLGAATPMEVSQLGAGCRGTALQQGSPGGSQQATSRHEGRAAQGKNGSGASTSGVLPDTVQQLLNLGVPQDIAVRQAAYELVRSGQIQETRATLDACYGPELLRGQPSLDFRLHVAQFCQVLEQGGPLAMEQALAYAREHLTPQQTGSVDASCSGRSNSGAGKLSAEEEQELLGDALSLLAYDHPESAPAGHLLGQGHRDALAEAVNGAILAHQGAPPSSPLERLSRQVLAVTQALRDRNNPRTLLLDTQALIFGS